MFQTEHGSAKRFKPMLVSKDETSLKIRISRCGSARSQSGTPPSSDDGGGGAKFANGGSPRLRRPVSPVNASPPPVKQELKLCEVRMNNLSSNVKAECDKEEEEEKDMKPQPVPRLYTSMTASEIVDECSRVGPGPGPISTSILAEGEPIPVPKVRAELPKLSPSQLLPSTPCVQVKNKQEAFSPQLLEWCLQRPITVIRGLAQVCEMDLSLYTTKSLVESHPNHPVEIRTQLEQSSDENWDPALQHQVANF